MLTKIYFVEDAAFWKSSELIRMTAESATAGVIVEIATVVAREEAELRSLPGRSCGFLFRDYEIH
jgi:hypothetical protein